MPDIEAYRAFLQQYSPYGYGLLFLRTGDFTAAQHRLREALGRRCSGWESRGSPPSDGAGLMAEIVNLDQPDPAPAREAPPASAYRGAQKLQAIDGAVGILRSFPPEEQLALFLLHVEEIPEPQVLSWLGRDATFLEKTRAALDGRLADVRPGTSAGEEGGAFFRRALRQYRLSSQFYTSVCHDVRAEPFRWSSVTQALGWLLLLANPLLLLPQALSRHGYANFYDDPPGPRAAFALTSPNLLDFALALLSLLAGRYLSLHAPPALATDSARGLGPALKLTSMVGFGFLASEFLTMASPAYGFRGDASYWWFVLQQVWRLAATGALLIAAYRVGVHYLKGVDARTAASARGGER